MNTDGSTWLNIDGVHDVDVMTKVGKQYRLHTLLLEDVMNAGHRAKMEEYDGHLFFTMKMLSLKGETNKIVTEQLSMVLGQNWVISFLEHPGDIFDPIRERLKEGAGRVRQRKCDYLVFLLMDAVVDNYFLVSDHLEGMIEDLEKKIMNDPKDSIINELQSLQKDIIFIRKCVAPLREEVSAIAKSKSDYIDRVTVKYFRDLYDHVVHVLESLDSSRDMLNNLFDMYHNVQGMRMNQIMKLLTLVSSIFIPLTFIAGIYGMNFNPEASPLSMPELNWEYGYLIVWGTMITIVVLMLLYFKKRKWL